MPHHIPPVDTLPNEILVKIFTAGSFAPRGVHELPFPLLAASISKRWRAVAVDSAEVWGNCILYSDDRDPVALAHLWKERSGAFPIAITVHLDSRNVRSLRAAVPSLAFHSPTLVGGRLLKEALEVLAARGSSWTSLTSKESRGVPFHHTIIIYFLGAAITPRLQHVDFRSGTRAIEDVIDPELDIVGALPALRHVRLQGQARVPRILLLHVTTLDVYSLFTEHAQLRALFDATPSLQTLVLRKLHNVQRGPRELSNTDILSESLRSLAISFQWQPRGEPPHPSLLSYVLFPNLEYLELEGEFFPALASYFHPDPSTFSHLRTLRLCRPEIRFDEQDLALFRRFSGLKRLELIARAEGEIEPLNPPTLVRSRSIGRIGSNAHRQGPPDGSSILQLREARKYPFSNRDYSRQIVEAPMILAPSLKPNERFPFFPELEVIVLHTTGRLSSDVRWLIASLTDRADAGQPIKKLVLSDAADQAVGKRLLKFIDEGLQVERLQDVVGLIDWEDE